MELRQFQISDARPLWELKYQTIREYCIKDYSLEQVSVWAANTYDEESWTNKMRGIKPFVAVNEGTISGYADLQPDGYIDHFYCSKNYIGKGVGGHLMNHILTTAKKSGIKRLYSHVSITAKPFFEHFGFKVIKAQQVNVNGIELTNYVMELIDVRS